MPLFRRVAKRGFSAGDSSVQKYVAVVNVGQIDKLAGYDGVIDCDVLIGAGLVPRRTRNLRILGGGEVTKVAKIRATYLTRSAIVKLQAVGGSYELV